MRLNIVIALLTIVFCCGHVKSVVSAAADPRTPENGLVKEEPRKKQQDSLMSRILPMLASPFIMQVTMLPMVLMGMKFMLLSSMILGKLGILLWIFHLIRTNNDRGGGLYSHNVNIEHNQHPGHFNNYKNYQYSPHYNYRRKRRSLFR